MFKNFILILFTLSVLSVQAQKRKRKSKNKNSKEVVLKEVEVEVVEEVVMEAVEIEETAVEAEAPSDYSSNTVYLENVKYKISKINDHCYFYYKSYNNYNKYGILKNRKKLLPPIFKTDIYTQNKEKIILGLNNDYGLFNLTTEKWSVPLENKSIKSLSGDLYAIKKNKYFILKDVESGEILVDDKWTIVERVYDLSNYYIVKKDGLKGVYNIISKRMVIPLGYESIRYISNLKLFKVSKNKKYNIIDINNNLLFDNWYDVLETKKESFIVKKDGKMGIINNLDQEIVPITYKNIKTYAYNNTNSYIAQNNEGKFGLITLVGKITLPFIYNNIIDKYGYAQLISDEKCGILVNKEGKPNVIASCNYDSVDKKNSYYIVNINDKYGLLDAQGNTVLNVKYDNISNINGVFILDKKNASSLFSNGKISKKKFKKLKALKNSGAYSYNTFNNKYFIVQCSNNKYGLIDALEEKVVPCTFDNIESSLSNNLIVVKENNLVGVYNILKQKIIVTPAYDQIIKNKNSYYGIKGTKIDRISLGTKVTITHL